MYMARKPLEANKVFVKDHLKVCTWPPPPNFFSLNRIYLLFEAFGRKNFEFAWNLDFLEKMERKINRSNIFWD